MKTIVCGPPHSGKSVMIANLLQYMPSDSFQKITANGDGEGFWSNNPDQVDVQSVRKKTKNSDAEFALWTNLIKKAGHDIVLVDVGGLIKKDKNPLFDECDSFIILCSQKKLDEDPEMIDRWYRYGTAHGCICIAKIISRLEGEESISVYQDNYLEGTICGLERGQYQESSVLKALAETLIARSGYATMLNLLDVGKRVGAFRRWKTSNGVAVDCVNIKTDNAPAVYDILKMEYADLGKVKIRGAHSLWLSAVTVLALNEESPCTCLFYDYWTNCYKEACRLEHADNPNDLNHGLMVETELMNDAVLLKYTIPDLGIDSKHYMYYKVPYIDESKDLYLSGRFPSWFAASVVLSYNVKHVYVHLPGVGYVCCKHEDSQKLGEIIKI